MATTYTTTFQLRRGQSHVWTRNNPVLAAGEPGFELDTNRLKIGDGSTPWVDLKYVGEEEVYNAPTFNDFPSIGRTNTIYKAEIEQKLYQWNEETQSYELLSESITVEAITEEEIDDILTEN